MSTFRPALLAGSREFVLPFALAISSIGFTSPAEAGVPCAATSGRAMAIGGLHACNDADGVFSWQGNRSTIEICVTVRDCAMQPVEGSSVFLALDVAGDLTDEFSGSAEMRINIDGDLTGTTDAQGVSNWEVLVGGCGKVQIDWTATADGVELGNDTKTYCIKSYDMNGNGVVNFFDTFLCLPQYYAGTGWAANWNCTQPVNFFDLFEFLPDLNAGAQAAVSTAATPATLGECAP